MKTEAVDFAGLGSIKICNHRLEMVVVSSLGPRIAFLGFQGESNLLYWKNDELGRQGWRLLGGHRVWITRPGADESEDAYAADNEPCRVSLEEDRLTVTGAEHPFLRTERGLKIQVLDETSFEVTSFVTNTGPMLYSGGVWAPTCLLPQPGQEFGILLGDRRLSWDLVRIVIPRKFAGHTAPVDDPQVRFSEDFMIVVPGGIETKRMLMAPMGIAAMTWPEKNVSFIKRSKFNPRGKYPLDCNLAIYNAPGNFMFEMESYGEEQTLIPGSTMELKERWTLVDQSLDWGDPEQVIDLSGGWDW